MSKIQKLKIFALLLLVSGFIGLGQSHVSAFGLPTFPSTPSSSGDTYSQDDQTKVGKLCLQKLNISPNSKDKHDPTDVGACEEGYILALTNPKDSSACDAAYGKDDKALKACKVTGFNLGKSNTLNVKAQPAKKKGGGNGCTGSSCAPTPTGQGKNCTGDNNCDLVALYVNPFIRLLTFLVGLIVAASLIMGGIQYSASSGDPQKTSAAKSRISNTLLALLAYAFMYAFLNFLVPGGVFH